MPHRCDLTYYFESTLPNLIRSSRVEPLGDSGERLPIGARTHCAGVLPNLPRTPHSRPGAIASTQNSSAGEDLKYGWILLCSETPLHGEMASCHVHRGATRQSRAGRRGAAAVTLRTWVRPDRGPCPAPARGRHRPTCRSPREQTYLRYRRRGVTFAAVGVRQGPSGLRRRRDLPGDRRPAGKRPPAHRPSLEHARWDQASRAAWNDAPSRAGAAARSSAA